MPRPSMKYKLSIPEIVREKENRVSDYPHELSSFGETPIQKPKYLL